jgi:hypothetical protein
MLVALVPSAFIFIRIYDCIKSELMFIYTCDDSQQKASTVPVMRASKQLLSAETSGSQATREGHFNAQASRDAMSSLKKT